MPLPFGKKKKKDAQAEPVQSNAPKVKRHNDTMASVLRESVVETVMSEFKANSPFVVQFGGKTYYVGLYFDTETIGGLSKKSSRDEAKGQLIESISSGHIAALITDELMQIESMVLIPNSATLDAMTEYEILRKLSFPLCYVSPDGQDIELTGVKKTVDECIDMLSLGNNIGDELLAQSPPGAASMEEDDLEPAEDETQGTFVDQEPDESFEDDAGAGFSERPPEVRDGFELRQDDQYEDPDDDDMPFESDTQDDIGYDDVLGDSDSPDYPDDEPDDDDDDMSYQDDDDDEEVIETVDGSAFEQAISRRLYSGELNLEITTEPFDSKFMHQNDVVLFDESRPEGWLNEQLNQMAKAANLELRRMHQENLLRCRSLYFDMISRYCDEITRKLDYQDENNPFGQMYVAILDEAQESERNLGALIDERKRIIQEEFEQGVKNAADSAAATAAQEYRERHSRQHSDRMYNIEFECREKLKDDKQDAIRQMNDMRRAEAATQLDVGVTTALKEVSDIYLKHLEEERAFYEKTQKEMAAFLDENRAHEIARISTLNEELAQTDRANAVMAEYAAKMQTLRDQFATQETLLKAEADRLEKHHRDQIQELKMSHKSELQALQDKLATSAGEADKLRDQLVHMDEIKDKQYEARMQELAGEREAFSRKYEHLADMQKKTGAIIIIAAVIGIIAALAVGFAAGMFATRGDSTGFQNIQLPEGYVLVTNEDGSARVVLDPETNQDAEYDIPDSTGQIPDTTQPEQNNDAGQEAGEDVTESGQEGASQ